MREVLILMLMKPQDHPPQRAEPFEYSKYRRSSRYTLWKARRWSSGCSKHVLVLKQQLWQTNQFFNIIKP